ncbi:unnamed protein product, partial [marine sediment metagenome]
MIVKQINNAEDIKKVLCVGAIYECITDDECPHIDDFEPPTDQCYTYIAGYANGEIIAIMVYHKYLDGNECHIQVLPEHRKQHAKDFAEQALLFRGTLPLYAEIPDLYKNVLNFACSFGFEVIDVKENDYIKN